MQARAKITSHYRGDATYGDGIKMFIVLCSWARNFTLTVPLSTRWGVTFDGLASHPWGVARVVSVGFDVLSGSSDT